jgi:hypothetical protein
MYQLGFVCTGFGDIFIGAFVFENLLRKIQIFRRARSQSRKASIILVRSVSLSVCPRVLARLQLEEFW